MADAQNYTCYCCGAAVAIDSTNCSYCENPVRITTFQSVWNLPNPTVNKYLSSYQKASADEQNNSEPIAFCYLKLKLHDKALQYFEKAMTENFDNSEIFFYAAICCLKGKKAFLAPRTDIDRSIEYIEAAKMIEPRAIYDYFKRKGYSINPNYEMELITAQTKGLALGDIEYLHEILTTPRPAEM
jgi:tetratricopeptide (TPR) repeat protein